MIIEESGMKFGDYDEENVFHIEKSSTYREIEKTKNSAVKSVELLLLRKGSIIFLEAKKSSPKNSEDLENFCDDIAKKVIDSLLILIALKLKLREEPQDFFYDHLTPETLQNIPIKFVLVIKGHKREWLSPIKEILDKIITKTINNHLSVIFNLQKIETAVLNDELAKEKKLLI